MIIFQYICMDKLSFEYVWSMVQCMSVCMDLFLGVQCSLGE